MRRAPAGLQGHQLQRKSASVILVTSLDGTLKTPIICTHQT